MNCYVPVPVKDKEKQMLMIFVRLLIVLSSLFPECNVWSSLEQNYNLLKSMLSQKYGVPTEVVEQFHGSPVPKTNNDKLFELSMDRCTWYTLYETPKGDIKLSLQKRDWDYFVSLMYYDKINTDAVRSSAIDDL